MSESYAKLDEDVTITKHESSKDFTMTLEGFLYDANKADEFIDEVRSDKTFCGGMYHRKQLEGMLRLLLPLVNLWACISSLSPSLEVPDDVAAAGAAPGVGGCCAAYLPFLEPWIVLLAVHTMLGAYPLLCCARPAFDFIDIFTDCCLECNYNFNLLWRWIQLKICKTDKSCVCVNPCASACAQCPPPAIKPYLDVCGYCLCKMMEPVNKCFFRLRAFAHSLPLWTVVFVGLFGPFIDVFYMMVTHKVPECGSNSTCAYFRLTSTFCSVMNAAITGMRLAYGSSGDALGKIDFYTKLV